MELNHKIFEKELREMIEETIDGERRFYKIKNIPEIECDMIILIDKCGNSDLSALGRVEYLCTINRNLMAYALYVIQQYLSLKLSNG